MTRGSRRSRSVGDVLEPELAERGQGRGDEPLATPLLAEGDDQSAVTGSGLAQSLVQGPSLADQRGQGGGRGLPD